MTDAAPWESDPIDQTAVAAMATAPGSAPGAVSAGDRPMTIRVPVGQQQAAPVPAPAQAAPQPQPSSLQGVGTAAADAPWDADPVDTSADPSAAPSWLGTAGDVAQSAATGLERGVIGAVTLPVTAASLMARGLKRLTDPLHDRMFGPAPPTDAPDPDIADVLGYGPAVQGIEALAGPMYQPQTTAGQYAETVGEFAPGAAGRGLADALKYVVAPGVASEAAGQATQGSPLEPWARSLAPIAVGGVSALTGRPSAAGKVLADAAGPVSPTDLASAQALMDAATQQGTPLSLAEAVHHVTGGATMLPNLQRAVEQSQTGGPTMAQFYAGRPQQVQQAGNAAIDRIAPAPAEPTATVAPAVQAAAEQTIGDAHSARTAATSPLYQAAGRDTVPANRVNAVLSHLDAQIAADKTGKLAPHLAELRDSLTAQPAIPAVPATPPTRVPVTGPQGQVVRYDTRPGTSPVPAQPRVPVTDVENISRVRKFYRDRIDLPQFADKAIDKESGAKIGNAIDVLDKVMSAASPAYKAANAQHAALSRDIVEPLTNGMVGKLSRAGEFEQQANIVLARNPAPGSEREVADAVRLIAARDPQAARDLVSQRIRQDFNEATRNNLGGPNQGGGAKFAAAIAGNSQQARNLRAAVEALQGPRVWHDFRSMLDVFEAMGRRLPPGSPTEPLRQFNETLGKGGMVGTAAAVSLSPGKWLSQAKDIYKGWSMGRNSAELAALLTRPDAAAAFASIAKHPPGSGQAQGLAAAYLLSTAASQRGKAEAK